MGTGYMAMANTNTYLTKTINFLCRKIVMMKKIIFISIYTIYLIIFVGLILHTSPHPQIFGKYTYKYFAIIILQAILFVPFIYFFKFMFSNSIISGKKK
jgi:hypothetical protein